MSSDKSLIWRLHRFTNLLVFERGPTAKSESRILGSPPLFPCSISPFVLVYRPGEAMKLIDMTKQFTTDDNCLDYI